MIMTNKLLVIDDEKSITTIVSRIASAHGYDVLVVNDPAVALETYRGFRPDVVMLDLIMPELDGIDILRALIEAGPPRRIVVMTGFGAGYMRLAQAVAEFGEHPPVIELQKPFRRVDVLAALDRGPATEVLRRAVA